ncbi:hypothetical protein [Nocardia fluminea]|uniref:hypothetical protein n=1 Tax=Nocardia fluminea TaxID=134984 RepID=UPI0033EFDCAF
MSGPMRSASTVSQRLPPRWTREVAGPRGASWVFRIAVGGAQQGAGVGAARGVPAIRLGEVPSADQVRQEGEIEAGDFDDRTAAEAFRTALATALAAPRGRAMVISHDARLVDLVEDRISA